MLQLLRFLSSRKYTIYNLYNNIKQTLLEKYVPILYKLWSKEWQKQLIKAVARANTAFKLYYTVRVFNAYVST